MKTKRKTNGKRGPYRPYKARQPRHVRRADPGLDLAFGKKTMQQIADELGITIQAVSQWERVPSERMIELGRFCRIPLSKLRPDLYGRE